MTMRTAIAGLVFGFLTCALPGAASGDVKFCDSAWENCRTELIRLIRAETRGIYTIQWYTRDTYVVGELIKKHRAGVPVRFIVDRKSESATRSGVIQQIYTMRDAGIPLREGPTKYVHAKVFIFVGQRTIQFGAPNLSQYEWMPNVPFKSYRNENSEFHYQESLADSLITIYENLWASSPYLRDYANMTSAHRARLNPSYPKDPRWSVQPMDAFSTRLVPLIDQESAGIDVNVLRFESESLANALIRRHRAGVPVRVNTEFEEYRVVKRPMVSFILDTLWAAGVPLKWRAHSGNNHEKVGIFHGQRVLVRGSSNWSPGSDKGNTNIEINFFSNPLAHPEDLDAYAHFVPKFERRWSNLQYVDGLRVIESRWFVPQTPGSSTYLVPANASTLGTTTPTLSFRVQWAHYVDVYYGRSSTAMSKYKDRMRVASNGTVNVKLPVLAAGSYYWRVVARTAAAKTSTGPIWSFRVA
jgi:phosphatidylserine/phosphatidylglycerophosphate/cardiolipin synthase-like enzyme